MKLPSVTQAFVLHFVISLAVFCALIAVMFTFWFPGNLFFMEGGWEGLKIIAPIDLVLGPALTLIFYRPWKKNVKFDMSVIVAIQVVALGYGVFAAYNQRTAAIVFTENRRFETLSYNEFKAAQKINEEKGRPSRSLEDFGGKMPVLVYADPYVGEDYREYLTIILNGGLELRERIDRYRPIGSLTNELDEFRLTDDVPLADRDSGITEVPASVKPDGKTEELRFELKARYSNGELVLNPETYEINRITPDE